DATGGFEFGEPRERSCGLAGDRVEPGALEHGPRPLVLDVTRAGLCHGVVDQLAGARQVTEIDEQVEYQQGAPDTPVHGVQRRRTFEYTLGVLQRSAQVAAQIVTVVIAVQERAF